MFKDMDMLESCNQKKISTNKKEVVATGGGPYNQIYISKKEEVVGQICGLYAYVEGIQNANSAGGENDNFSSSSSEDDLNESVTKKSDVSHKRKRDDAKVLDLNPGTSKKYKQSLNNSACSIKDHLKHYIEADVKRGKEFSDSLQKISEILEKTNESINAIGANVRRVYKSVESLTTNLTNELKRHHKEIEKAAIEKNKLKKLDVEIKQKQFELEKLKEEY